MLHVYISYGRGAVALSFVTGCRDPQDNDLANSSHAFLCLNLNLGNGAGNNYSTHEIKVIHRSSNT